jgi:hypothetical protein
MNGCASSGSGDGTDPFVRIGYFTTGTTVDPTGEVAAAGYLGPMATVDGWMDEPAGSDGHRTNLTDQGVSSHVMGFGHAADASGCYVTYAVSDSGDDSALVATKLPTAAVSPSHGSAGSYVFYATWADSNGAPSSIDVVVDGTCTTMTKELGSDTLNATYKATVALAAGCHQYRVVAYDKSNARQAYPTTGALTVASGGSCSADYESTAMTASCDVMMAGSMDGAVTTDAGEGNGDLSTRSAAAPDLATEPPADFVTQGGGCDFVPASSGASAIALMACVIVLLVRRRRTAR